MTVFSTVDQDDDIFARPPRSARRTPLDRTARRSCRACDLTYVVALDYDGPPLCEPCRADIGATRARVRALLEAEQVQERAAWAAWEAVRAPEQAAWDRIEDSRTLPDFAARCEAHRTQGNVYGKLLEAHEAFVTEVERLSVERARFERALECLGYPD